MPRKTLVLIPPFSQLNGPYASLLYLCGYLRSIGEDAESLDVGLECSLKLFSRQWMAKAMDLLAATSIGDAHVARMVERRDEYLASIDPVVAFLQGKNEALARRIALRNWLPEGKHFAALAGHEDFMPLEIGDGARWVATMFLEDCFDLYRHLAPQYGFSRYAEKLAASQASFDVILADIDASCAPLDDILESVMGTVIWDDCKLAVVTIPFPGNLAFGLRMARWLKSHHPHLRMAAGGGYVNTELRHLGDARIFDYFDFLCFDEGEAPLRSIVSLVNGTSGEDGLVRTATATRQPRWIDEPVGDYAPSWKGLDPGRYLSLSEEANPMLRLWSERGWGKLRMAKGCYWAKCSFCDTSLPYIRDFHPAKPSQVLDHAKAQLAETCTGAFHFVDEAMPPAQTTEFARLVDAERLPFTWWGNVRYDRGWTPARCKILARGGCVAVSGGLEGLQPDILVRQNKGCSTAEMLRALAAFAQADIMTHAYLIYNFPGTSQAESIDAMEILRQAFAQGIVASAYWHCFSLTVHSPVYANQRGFGVEALEAPTSAPVFARNDVAYTSASPDLSWLGKGLALATHNWMQGIALDESLQFWFEVKVPKSRLPGNFVASILD